MGLSYPLATHARAALDAEEGRFVKTKADAQRLANGPVTLVTEWFKPNGDDLEPALSAAERHMGTGFVQIYEDDEGEAVLAISYWKAVTQEEHKAAKEEASRLQAEAAIEHTTDLYFTKPEERRKRFGGRRSRAKADPNQMDFFVGPALEGNEVADPDNPDIIIVESEGDGTTFGGG